MTDYKPPAPNAAYYDAGKTWEITTYAALESSRNRAYIIAGVSVTLLAVSVLAIVMMMPLKTVEPYVVTVDRHTGHAEITKRLIPGTLTEKDAITRSNLSRYVTHRERYNPHIYKEDHALIYLMSDKDVSMQFAELFTEDNPNNPSRGLGRKGTADVHVKTISFINEETAQIRFKTSKRINKTITESHWIAIVTFRYTNTPMKEEERNLNPLGFQVISYRKSQEILEN